MSRESECDRSDRWLALAIKHGYDTVARAVERNPQYAKAIRKEFNGGMKGLHDLARALEQCSVAAEADAPMPTCSIPQKPALVIEPSLLYSAANQLPTAIKFLLNDNDTERFNKALQQCNPRDIHSIPGVHGRPVDSTSVNRQFSNMKPIDFELRHVKQTTHCWDELDKDADRYIMQVKLDGTRVVWDGHRGLLLFKEFAISPPASWCVNLPKSCFIDGELVYTTPEAKVDTPTQFASSKQDLARVQAHKKTSEPQESYASLMSDVQWRHVKLYAFDIIGRSSDTTGDKESIEDFTFVDRQRLLTYVLQSSDDCREAYLTRPNPSVEQLPCYAVYKGDFSSNQTIELFRARGAQGVVYKLATSLKPNATRYRRTLNGSDCWLSYDFYRTVPGRIIRLDDAIVVELDESSDIIHVKHYIRGVCRDIKVGALVDVKYSKQKSKICTGYCDTVLVAVRGRTQAKRGEPDDWRASQIDTYSVSALDQCRVAVDGNGEMIEQPHPAGRPAKRQASTRLANSVNKKSMPHAPVLSMGDYNRNVTRLLSARSSEHQQTIDAAAAAREFYDRQDAEDTNSEGTQHSTATSLSRRSARNNQPIDPPLCGSHVHEAVSMNTFTRNNPPRAAQYQHDTALPATEVSSRQGKAQQEEQAQQEESSPPSPPNGEPADDVKQTEKEKEKEKERSKNYCPSWSTIGASTSIISTLAWLIWDTYSLSEDIENKRKKAEPKVRESNNTVNHYKAIVEDIKLRDASKPAPVLASTACDTTTGLITTTLTALSNDEYGLQLQKTLQNSEAKAKSEEIQIAQHASHLQNFTYALGNLSQAESNYTRDLGDMGKWMEICRSTGRNASCSRSDFTVTSLATSLIDNAAPMPGESVNWLMQKADENGIDRSINSTYVGILVTVGIVVLGRVVHSLTRCCRSRKPPSQAKTKGEFDVTTRGKFDCDKALAAIEALRAELENVEI